MTDTLRNDAPTSTSPLLQVLATLSVLNVVWLFVTAGQLFPRGGPEELHAWGAIVLHVTTGLTAVAAAAHWRATHGPLWPTVLATVVFGLSFAQAWYGSWPDLDVHVPGALVLTAGSVWVMAWSFTGHRSERDVQP